MTRDGEGRRALSRRDYLDLVAATAATGLAGCSEAVVPDLRERRELDSYYAGPESARPAGAPAGTRYFATDSGKEFVATESGWAWQSLATPALSADRIEAVADHVVSTTADLERAFSNLSAGDTVYVGSGTYRTTRWLDVNVDDVTIVGAGRRGTLVKPADGANVGGIRIGVGRHVENVRVSGVGFHGNDRTMDDAVKRLHGFVVADARNVTLRDCYATRTHPYHAHDVGGSGFTVRRQARDVAVVENHTEDVGDRGVQLAGSDVVVARNRLVDGFDRAIALDVRHPDGLKYYARNVSIVANVCRNNTDGSIIGASQGRSRRSGAGNYAIVGNVASERHRRLVYLGIEQRDVSNVAVVGNTGRQSRFTERRPGIYVSGGVSDVVVSGNSLADYSGRGIEIDTAGTGVVCTGNTVTNAGDDGIFVGTAGATVTNNVVESPSGRGIDVLGAAAIVSNNAVTGAGGDGVHLASADAGSVVVGNVVDRSARRDRTAAEFRVEASNSVVGLNHVVARRGRYALREDDDADGNVYVGNHFPRDGVDGRPGDAWHLSGAHSQAVGNAPPVGVHRRLAPEDGTATVDFDRPYDRRPMLEVTTEEPALWGVDWHREDGQYVGATLSFVSPDGDVVNPRTRVAVRRG